AVKIAKRMPVTDANGNQRPYCIDDALAKLRTTSRAAFMSQKLTRPRETLQNASDAIRIMEDYGARYWGSAGEAVSPEADAQRQAEYLRNVREQVEHLLKHLHTQLQTSGQHIVDLLTAGDSLIPAGKPAEEEQARKSGAAVLRRLERATGPLSRSQSTSIETLDSAGIKALLADTGAAAQELLAAEQDTERLVRRWQQGDFAQEATTSQEATTQAERFAVGSELMESALRDDPDTAAKLRDLRPALATDPRCAAALSETMQARRDLVQGREQTLAHMEQESQQAQAECERGIAAQGMAEWTHRQEGLFAQERDGLLRQLTHPVCGEQHLNVTSYVEELTARVQRNLNLLRDKRIGSAGRQELSAEVAMIIRQTQKTRERLEQLEHAVQTVGQTGNPFIEIIAPAEFVSRGLGNEKTRGCTVAGKIYLNSAFKPEERAKTLKHEQAHAMLWILTEETLLFPALIADRVEKITPENMRILEERGRQWGITREEVRAVLESRGYTGALLDHLTEDQYRRELTEEAIVRRAIQHEQKHRVSREERRALDAVAPPFPYTPTPQDTLYFRRRPKAYIRKEQDTDDLLPEPDAPDMEGMANAPASETSHSCSEDLDQIDGMLQKIQSFGEAYPTFKEAVTHAIGTGQEKNKPLGIVRELRFIHRTGRSSDGLHAVPNPDQNDAFYTYVQEVKKYITDISNKVDALDKKALDEVENAKKSKRSTISEKLGIRWLCILDIMRIWKELKEDITGMWTSMQDQKTADAKADLYKNLPVYIPGTNIKIPIIGKYTERMPHYAERRRNQLELERVKKWEDAFKNLDAEDLLTLIGNYPTKDQLRASIELLVGKGLMNWGDRRVWKALNEKSKYQMPIEPCARNEILRDMWLNKLISQIWGDRDMFNGWKSSNDKNYDGQKSAYTHTADSLSNVSGQLGKSLESILSQFVRNTDETGKPKHKLPEEVNPHHYEELLHYAMRNGKMSMEQKMFYLIQGIRFRLIGIERLRVLAGEKGELLAQFPLLDYFYSRHNTYAEVKRLGEMLDESKTDDDIRFKPGAKTTMFLRLILAKDDGVVKRVNKATTRVMEKVDHEDVPYILTDVNFHKMKNLIGNVSGDRWKVTNQGMQNTYVGFNEKFKIFAMVAQMEQEGKAVFSDEFVRSMAESAAAYVFFDNQVVRAGIAKENYSNLSWNEINDQVPASAGGNLATAQYRNRMRDFTQRLVAAMGITDADLAGYGVTVADMIASEQRDHSDVGSKNDKVNKASDHFCQLFEDRVKANPDALKRLLREWQAGSMPFLDWKSDASGKGQVSRTEFEREYQRVMTQG
ncbi:MAG: hypothetical protein PHS73_00295, partial [Candidatus Peribacteraceae bacterium]|nr:hypothetical protein [Candidatus Peribacteraceae bacterium]